MDILQHIYGNKHVIEKRINIRSLEIVELNIHIYSLKSGFELWARIW